MWNEDPESIYHTLPRTKLVMQAIEEKSNSNSEESASPPPILESCLLDFLFEHFVA